MLPELGSARCIYAYQHRRAFRLDDTRKAGPVLLTADIRLHQETEADARCEEVVEYAIDTMSLDKPDVTPANPW